MIGTSFRPRNPCLCSISQVHPPRIRQLGNLRLGQMADLVLGRVANSRLFRCAGRKCTLGKRWHKAQRNTIYCRCGVTVRGGQVHARSGAFSIDDSRAYGEAFELRNVTDYEMLGQADSVQAHDPGTRVAFVALCQWISSVLPGRKLAERISSHSFAPGHCYSTRFFSLVGSKLTSMAVI
jgi:hypothetical protein